MKHFKRFVSLALALTMVLGFVPDGLPGSIAELLPAHTVEAEDILEIDSQEDWENFAQNFDDYEGKTVQLTADITLSGSIPMRLLFDGTFDGNGHTITIANDSQFVTAYASAIPYSGLFCEVNGGTVKNLVIYLEGMLYGNTLRSARSSDGESFRATTEYGILAGHVCAESTIQNVAVSGPQLGIFRVATNANLYNDANVGGIVGLLENSTVEQCFSSIGIQAYRFTDARREGTLRAAGIVGFARGSIIRNCLSSGVRIETWHSNPDKLENSAGQAGGIVAEIVTGTTISNCVVDSTSLKTEDITESKLGVDQSLDSTPWRGTSFGTAGYLYTKKDDQCTTSSCYCYNSSFVRTGVQVTDGVTIGTDAESKAKQALIGDMSIWVESVTSKLGLAWMFQTPKVTLTKNAGSDGNEDVSIQVSQYAPHSPRGSETTWQYTIQAALLGQEATPGRPTVESAQSVAVTKVEILESRTEGDGKDPTEETHYSGGTYQFYAKVTGNNITSENTPVTWSLETEDAGSTTIDASTGTLTVAQGFFGNLTIKATAGGQSASVTITIWPGALTIEPASTEVAKGGKVDFSGTMSGYFANTTPLPYAIEWSVDGTDSSIDENGTLTVGAGETKSPLTVTATFKTQGTLSAEDKALLPTATATVTVKDAETETVTVKPAETEDSESATLDIGDKLTVTIDSATGTPSTPEGYQDNPTTKDTFALESDNGVLTGSNGSYTAAKAGTETVTVTRTFTFTKKEEPASGEDDAQTPSTQADETTDITWTAKVKVTVNAVANKPDKAEQMTSAAGNKKSAEYSNTPIKTYSLRFPTAVDSSDTRWYQLTTSATPATNWTKLDNDNLLVELNDEQQTAIRGNGLYLWMYREGDGGTMADSPVVGWLLKETDGEVTTTPVGSYTAREERAYFESVTVTGTWKVEDGKIKSGVQSYETLNTTVLTLIKAQSEYSSYTSLADCEVTVTVRQTEGLYTSWSSDFVTETTQSVAIGDAALKPTIQPRESGQLPNNKFTITVPNQTGVSVYYQIYPNMKPEEIASANYPGPNNPNSTLYDPTTQKEISYPTDEYYNYVTVIAISYPSESSTVTKQSEPDIVTFTADNLVKPEAPTLLIGDNEADFAGGELYDNGTVFKFRFAPNTTGGEAYQVYYTTSGSDPNVVGGVGKLYDPANPPTLDFGLFTEITIKAVVFDPNYQVQSSVATFTVQSRTSAEKPVASLENNAKIRPSQNVTLELASSFVERLPDISSFVSASYEEYSADSATFKNIEDNYTQASNSEEPIEGVRYLIVNSGETASSAELPIIRYSTNTEDVLEDVGKRYQYAVCQIWNVNVTDDEGKVTSTTTYYRFTNPDDILLEGSADQKITLRAAVYPPSGVTKYLASGEITYTYTVRGSVAAPTAIPGTDSSVDIGTAIALSGDAGTEIFYTTDGSSRPEVEWVPGTGEEPGHWEPANDKTIKYESDIIVPYTTQKLFILRAIAVSSDDSLEASAMTSFIYNVNPLEKAAAPTASPTTDSSNPTRLVNGERITLTTTTLDTDILYTTDGSVPSWSTGEDGELVLREGTQLYDTQQGIQMKATEENEFFFITAVAVDKNRELPSHESSDAVSYVYRIAQTEAPTASPATSTSEVSVIEPNTTITLTSGTVGAEIYYTKDTTLPVVTDTEAVKKEYQTWLAGWNAANEKDRGTDARGIRWYNDEDGTKQTEPSTIPYDATEGVTMPRTITTFFTLRAVAVVSDGSRADSEVVTISYQLPEQVQAVYASPIGGTAVEYGTSVTLSCSTEGAQIFYKVYESEPGEDDAPVVNQDLGYTEPITITKEVWIQAVATKSGMESNVATYHYTVAPTAASPTVSLPGGSVVPKGTRITLSGEGTIVYTLDGSDPKAADSAKQYGTTVNLDGEYGSTITLRAYIQRDGYTPSDVVSFTYTICAEEDYLNISVESGSVIESGTSVTLSTAVTNGQIFYTLDGSTPQVKNVYSASKDKDYTTYEWASNSSSTVAGSGFTLSGNPDSAVTVRAIVVVNGGEGGQVSTFTYKFQPQAASPTASIPSGAVVFDGATVTLNAKEGTIYYTLDGKDPTTSSSIYSEPIDVSGADSVVLKAMVVVEGKAASPVVEYRYSRAGQAGTPAFSVTSGEIDTGTTVALTSSTPEATIYYSTDGTTPTADNLTSLTLYVAPISITRAVTIRAIAVSDTLDPSDVAEATYTVREPVVEPEKPAEETVTTTTVTDRLTSRREFDSAAEGPSYSGVVLREAVCNTVLSAEEGVIPADALLTVTQETPSRSDEAAVNTSLGLTIARVYSASLTRDGDDVTPSGNVELGFAIPSEYQNGVVTVSRINDDGTLTQYTARRSGGMAYIETESLGRFALSVPQRTQAAGFNPWWIAGGGAVIAAAGLIVFLAARRRRRAEEAAAAQPFEDLSDFQNFHPQQ